MIILIGPDGSGKTTLAKKFEEQGFNYYHYVKDSTYVDYLQPLCKLEMTNAVLDRHMMCEVAYAKVMNRQFKYSIKQWHNVMMMTLIQKPLVVLCTHKPTPASYRRDQYLPYDKWDECLRTYKEFLVSNRIIHLEYDYAIHQPVYHYIDLSNVFSHSMEWWRDHRAAGYGCVGSSHPQFLLVAERIGPNNMNNIPFEAGPTGWMLSNMISITGTPLGVLTITNMVKAKRRDSRAVNDKDLELLREEITQLEPKKVIFMGSPARRGIPLARELGVDTDTIVHLGALNHKGVKDMSGYYNEWRKILGIVPKVEFK